MGDLMYGTSTDKPDLGLDLASETSFISWYNRMPPKGEDTVRLFDRGEFYSVHGQDALLVASIVYKTQSVIKTLGNKSDGLASITLNTNTAKSFLRDALTARQLKVEIWGGGSTKKNSWQLEKQATPGNLQELEDLLFASADLESSPLVVSLRVQVKDGTKIVGAAFADASNKSLGVAQFVENDLFSNTESLLIQLGAKECLVPEDETNASFELSKLKDVVDKCECVTTTSKKSTFIPKSVEADVNRLLKADYAGDNLAEYSLTIAMGAMQALLNYLSLTNDDKNFGQFSIRGHDLSQYMRLDHSALRALSVFPEAGQTGVHKSASLFGLLNQCKTPQGQRLLSQWLKQPLVNTHEIRKRHSLVEVFVDDSTARQIIQMDILRYMPDLLRHSKRFQRGVANLEDVVVAYQAVVRLHNLVSSLEDINVANIEYKRLLQATFIEPLTEAQSLLQKLIEMVETTIDLEELDRHRYVIKPEYDEQLMEIRDAKDRVVEDLHHHHISAKKDLQIDEKVRLEDTQQYGYCFRVTRIDSKVLNGKKDRYIELGTAKAGVYFTTRAVKELSNKFIDLQHQYSSHQSGLVKQVVAIAAGYCPPLEQLNVILANLDVLVCFSHVAMNAPLPYVRPEIISMGMKGSVEVRDARHPCLEVQDDLSFIPNDITMRPDSSEFLVITGPNMGGKSTYIRSVGVLALMSQAGCFVPAATGAKLPIFDSVLARVGAGDNQVKGVSTFMSEMLETSTILRLATEDSLIIIDELGRGTSTYDGFGLAWSISEHIATNVRSKCLFASHFAEIVELANQIPHVKNLHCKALVTPHSGNPQEDSSRQESEITLLYRVEPGTCDRSYGIQVAELAGFPPTVIKLAKRKAEEMEDMEDGEMPPLLTLDAETTAKGMSIVEDFLRDFSKRTQTPPSKRRDTGEDIDDVSSLVNKYKDLVHGNAWARKVLECL